MVVSNAAVWFATVGWIIFPLIAWSGVWKGIALWKAGKNRQLAWFVCIFIFNTLGILPIIYLIWFQKKSGNSSVARSSRRSSRKK